MMRLEMMKTLPLPNPNVFQDKEPLFKTETLQIVIPAEGKTEIKLVLQEDKVAIYS